MIYTTRGARISGLILYSSGVLTLIVAFIGYVYLTLMTVMNISASEKSESGEMFVLIGIWLGCISVHAMGQAMMRAGNYLQGKFGEMKQQIILQSSLCYVIKDVFVVQVGFCSIGCVVSFLAEKLMLAAAFVILLGVFNIAAYRLNRRLNVLDQERKENLEPTIF